MTATAKQIAYIHYLRQNTRYSGDWMNAAWKHLGASMRERSGKVDDYLRSISAAKASEIIIRLQSHRSMG